MAAIATFDRRAIVLEGRLRRRHRGLERSFVEARARLVAFALGGHGRRGGVGLSGARRLVGHVGARPGHGHATAVEFLHLAEALAVDVARRIRALVLVGDLLRLSLLLLRDLRLDKWVSGWVGGRWVIGDGYSLHRIKVM